MTVKLCRFGILGAATIARKNWQAILNSGNATLVAVASRDRQRAGQFIAECQASAPFAAPPRSCSYEELLAAEDIDAVYIPLPTGVRKEWVLKAAAAGKTFHLVDPAPLTARDVFEGVAAHAQTEKPRGSIPRPLARAVLRTPGLSRLGRGPLAFVDVLDHPVHYDATNTARALAGSGITCPALGDYLPLLVRYVLDVSRPADIEYDDVADPLD